MKTFDHKNLSNCKHWRSDENIYKAGCLVPCEELKKRWHTIDFPESPSGYLAPANEFLDRWNQCGEAAWCEYRE